MEERPRERVGTRTNSPRVKQHFPEGEGRTRQSMKEEVDINRIVGKYRQTGFIEHVNLKNPVYADFSNVLEYRESVARIERAEKLFRSLPARVRARVNNDPAQLIAFVEDPENAAELVELGLINPVLPRETEPEAAEQAAPKTGETDKTS